MRASGQRLTAGFPKDLAFLLVAFLLLATIYAWAIPYFQSSDELGHLEYVKRLTLEGHLPEFTRFEYFATEQHQPPGYYILASLVGWGLMASPLVGPAGQMALIFYGARGVSIAFGLATVAGAYLLARHFFGPRRLMAVAAAAIVAFNPGIIAIMGAVTNDSMATAVGAFVLFATVKASCASHLPLGKLLLIGALAGLAALTKENLLYLLLPLAAALILLAWRSGPPRYQLMVLLAVGVPAIAIGSWWYLVTPPVVTEARLKAEARPANAIFDGSMQLVGYRLDNPVVKPGDKVQLSLYWKALGRTTTIWTNYIHLIDSKDAIFGQYDSIPLREGYPALFWKKGEVWRDDIQFMVEPRAPNGYYRLQVGLYSLQTGKDAPVSAQGRQWVGGLLMGGIRLVAPVTRTLTSFVHLLDANSRVVAQHDGWPDMGRMPTFVWLPGETVRDQHEFKAPPGSYTLEVGLYDSETLQPVPMITGGRSLLLGEVSVP